MKMVSGETMKEMIKPSSPTPAHHRNLQFSFLDQLAPPTYIHIILYFRAPAATSSELKRSLSDTLAIYYPLAGRLRENSWVECNDGGAEYVEARFNNVRISDVVENPRPEELAQFVPLAPSGDCDVPLAVQASFFGCGGAALGICMSHRVADAMSMVMFINAWAATCCRDAKTIVATQPSFNISSRFSPSDSSDFFKSVQLGPPPPPPEKIVTKIFSFDSKKLLALKKASSGPLMSNPTRVEAVSAFIWKHLIDSASVRNPNTVFAATHAVDIRQRASPPLPCHLFGNACARAMAMTASTAQDYYSLALELRKVIVKADADYVRRLEDGGAFLKYYAVSEENDPALREGGKSVDVCGFTSWCRLPAYDADFGWGKPFWVSIISVPVKNLVIFLRTECGDGIEAWVSMVEEDIAVIESNFHLLDQVEILVN
ncbi:shikimate O-hydroxycinnamoyltransferase [Salvia divinorum]|uniref:Shikimate O-hydroxycinnamoyltransferase n=1 Tax=Salvia divinorum TaxID=28513 RepID=A0ABD1IF22_SALDI